MKKFNIKREKRKLYIKQHKSSIIKYSSIFLCGFILCLTIMYFSKADFTTKATFDLIDANVSPFITGDVVLSYNVDGVKTKAIDSTNNNYHFISSECSNGATYQVTGNDFRNGTIKNLSDSGTKCTIYLSTNELEPSVPELYDSLIPVKFTNNGSSVTYTVADTTNPNNEWYDYNNHKWANAVLVSTSNKSKYQSEGTAIDEADILQMYVWIPRYRYKLFNTGDGTSVNEQMIEIEFENCNAVNGVCSTSGYGKSNGTANNEWLTHPAFTFGSSELNGIWVGKFEPSHSTLSSSTTSNYLGCSNETCSNADLIRVLPNKVSMTYQDTATFFFGFRSIERNGNGFGIDSSKLDTHMIKNMEWGAVAYFTQSKYGLYETSNTCANPNQTTSNGCEIFINNINIGYGAGTAISGMPQWGPTVSGCSGATADASEDNRNSFTNINCASGYKWNENGVLASTTGNIYGIYDLSGGAWDKVMGNVSTSTTTYIFYTKYSGFTSQPNDKYLDKYLASGESTDEDQGKVQNRGLLGDATREIMKTYGSLTGGWNGDATYFPMSSFPWFYRGGRASLKSDCGIFNFSRAYDTILSYGSSRIVITAP